MNKRFVREYEILSVIGEGGMGKVFLACHEHLGNFAIKMLAPQLNHDQNFRTRFIEEAKIHYKLVHDNIVKINTLIEDKGRLFLVMEYVDGGSLDNLIQEKGKLPESQAVKIFKDILNGLNYAHARGIIHRDIKPSNIILNRNGTAKIMDFGIAITAEGKRITKTGTTVGTSWYMSPEQIQTPKNIDHRSDVYSMGAILYEMLTGNVPFIGENDFHIYQQHVNEPPKKIEECSNILWNIIKKALEKKPDDRFDGCGMFLEYIVEYEKVTQQAAHNKIISEKNSEINSGIETETETDINKDIEADQPEQINDVQFIPIQQEDDSNEARWIVYVFAMLTVIIIVCAIISNG